MNNDTNDMVSVHIFQRHEPEEMTGHKQLQSSDEHSPQLELDLYQTLFVANFESPIWNRERHLFRQENIVFVVFEKDFSPIIENCLCVQEWVSREDSSYLEDMWRQVCFLIDFTLHGATSASAVAVGTGVGEFGVAHAN